MGKSVYCERQAGFLRHAHKKCQEEYVFEMVSLMRSGRFRDAAVAAVKAVCLDPALFVLGSGLLSNVYLTAMCNSKEAEIRAASRNAKIAFHGLEEQIRSMDPALYKSVYEEEEPSTVGLDYTSRMCSCTLSALGCSYAQAHEIAEFRTRAVLAVAKPGSPDYLGARERFQTIRMMDEMYGAEGDKGKTGSPG